MEQSARDNTDEWRLPAGAAPPTIAELDARIDEALVIARSSEAAAIEIGAAAIESAEQAKRAADLAVRASEAAARGAAGLGEAASAGGADSARRGGERDPAPRATAASIDGAANGATSPPLHDDERLARFTHRADRLGARLAKLQRR